MNAPVSVPAPAKPPKTKRKDVYIASIKVTVPLDMTSADSLAAAIKAVKTIEGILPEGSTCEIHGTLGKV